MGGTGAEQAGLMILRAWVEPGLENGLRVRIIQASHGTAGAPVVRAAASIDDVCAVVRAWLLDLEGRPESFPPSSNR